MKRYSLQRSFSLVCQDTVTQVRLAFITDKEKKKKNNQTLNATYTFVVFKTKLKAKCKAESLQQHCIHSVDIFSPFSVFFSARIFTPKRN